MSGPLRSLQGVIDAVRKGEFAPDFTRSGYFKSVVGAESTESSSDEEDHEHKAAEEAVDHFAGEWQRSIAERTLGILWCGTRVLQTPHFSVHTCSCG